MIGETVDVMSLSIVGVGLGWVGGSGCGGLGGFEVDAIGVEEVKEVTVLIGWLCQLGLGLGVERGDVE